MSHLGQTFSTLVLLIVGLLSMPKECFQNIRTIRPNTGPSGSLRQLLGLQYPHNAADGTKCDYQKTLSGMDYRSVFNSPIDEFKVKTEISKVMKLNGPPQDSLRDIQEIKQKEHALTDLKRAQGIKLKRKLHSIVIGRHHLMNDTKPDQDINLRYQILPNAEEEVNLKAVEQFQEMEKIAQKIPQKSLGNRFLLRMMDNKSKFGNNVATLWRRGDEKSTETNKSEKDHQKTKESNSHSSTTSKKKGMFHPITDVFSKAKQKIKPTLPTTVPHSKTTAKSSSIGPRGETRAKSGLRTGLTSGYTSKPSGFGRMASEYPGVGFPAQYQEASHPIEHTQTFKRKVSKLLHRNSRRTDEAENSEGSPRSPRSPSMTTEVNRMWAFINRVSKTFGENENLPAPNEDSQPTEQAQQTEQTQPTHSLNSKSPGRTTPNVYQDGQRKNFLLTPKLQSSLHIQSSNIRTVDTKEEIEWQEDKNIIDYIIHCREGWFQPKVAPATGEDNELPPDRLSAPTTSRSPAQSPTRSSRPPARSPPSSPMNTTTRSPARHPSSTRSLNRHQSASSNMKPDPSQPPRQLSNKELNDGYTTLVRKIRSSERLGQTSEE